MRFDVVHLYRQLCKFQFVILQAGHHPDGAGQPEHLRLIRAKDSGKTQKPGAQGGKAAHPGLSHFHSFRGGMVGEKYHGHGGQQRKQVALQLGLTAPTPVVVDQVGKSEQAGHQRKEKRSIFLSEGAAG